MKKNLILFASLPMILSGCFLLQQPESGTNANQIINQNTNEEHMMDESEIPACKRICDEADFPTPEDYQLCLAKCEMATDIVDGEMMDKDGMMDDDAMMDDASDPMMGDEKISYSGTVLAGSASPLLDFNKSDYDKALTENKNIVVYFYANWCPTCKIEFPKMQAAFNTLSDENLVGFRVNFNDNQTDENETGLARQFGVAYQHTKVFIQNGRRILKSPESWDTETYLKKINDEF